MDTPSISRASGVARGLSFRGVLGHTLPGMQHQDSPIRLNVPHVLGEQQQQQRQQQPLAPANSVMVNPQLAARIEDYEVRLARRHTGASRQVARETAEILRDLVGGLRFVTGQELVDAIAVVGRRLISAQPLEFEVGNIVRRILFIAREEISTIIKEEDEAAASSSSPSPSSSAAAASVGVAAPSLIGSGLSSPSGDGSISRNRTKRATFADNVVSPNTSQEASSGQPAAAARRAMLSRTESRAALSRSMALDAVSVLEEDITALERPLSSVQSLRLKQEVIESIRELIGELSVIFQNIADQGPDHVHANEVIMTFGSSKTVIEFLRMAKKKGRVFSVIVAESAPSLYGRETVALLAKHGIAVTLIPDSAVFAMMPRVTKVVVGTHGVMANGSLIALTGALSMALAAKHYRVPFLCVCGLYKLTPLFPHDTDSYNDVLSPAAILPFEEADALEHVHVKNPAFDMVPAELVTLYITNFGGHSPSYVYRLLSDFYSPEDEHVSDLTRVL